MQDANAVTTPISTSGSLKLSDGSPATEPTQYRQVVGSLQYLALTRPDISFAVNKLSQFMHQPSTLHWSAVKRLLRYLKGTLNHGLFFRKHSPLRLHAFADADWQVTLMIEHPHRGILSSLVLIQSVGVLRSKRQSPGLQLKLNTVPLLLPLQNSIGSRIYSRNSTSIPPLQYIVIILELPICALIRYSTPA